MSRSFAVLDRDGTIISECHHLCDPDQVELIDGAASGLRELIEMGLGLVIVTNQSVVGRGMIDEAGLERIHGRLRQLLEAQGVQIDGIYWCPHRPEAGCACRKPGTALLEQAARDLHFEPATSFVIGDKECDIDLGRSVGATTLLVRTGHGAEVAATARPDFIVDDLGHVPSVVRRFLDARDPALARAHLLRAAETLRLAAEACAAPIATASALIAAAFARGGKLLLCGNGGSAADCQHMAAELVSRMSKDFDRRALPAIALTTDSSFLTGFANDSGFDDVFVRQVEALGNRGDVLLAISTSGQSGNVLRAARAARDRGMEVVALTGALGPLTALSDVSVAIPATDTQHIQEAHLAAEHAICALVELRLFGHS
jgi:D-glycero-D-manno-heptose 1,7-bisphosphate phosphatase